MSVLIPIISKKENNEVFLENAIKKEKTVYLLAIMDTNAATTNFGFATSEIGHGNELIEEIKTYLNPVKITVYDALEWGDTNSKILNYAKLKKIKKVALIKQDNKYFRDLVSELKENKIKVELF